MNRISTMRRGWLTSLMMAATALQVPAWGDENPVAYELPEYRDVELTREVQAAMRADFTAAAAAMRKKNNDVAKHYPYSAELGMHAYISAIEVSDGLLRLREDMLPDWISKDLLGASVQHWNRHIEQTIGHITSADDFRAAMATFASPEQQRAEDAQEKIIRDFERRVLEDRIGFKFPKGSPSDDDGHHPAATQTNEEVSN